MNIEEIVAAQRQFFNTSQTRDIGFRKTMLRRLLRVIRDNEEPIYAAVNADLGKSRAETYMTEIAMVTEEIETQLRHVDAWSRPRTVPGTMATFPSRSTVYADPYGVVLILSPWNYPVNLALTPLVGAIAAGNCVVLKCSRNSAHTSALLQRLLAQAFPSSYVCCLDADSDYDEILNQTYDYIFFTGSPRVGKTVMQAASRHLTPVSLELGGKSPCIVDESANLPLAAKRIVWGKFLNAGQTCISIDYILVQRSVKDALVECLVAEIQKRYANAETSDRYPNIINRHHYERLCKLLETEDLVIGGERNDDAMKIAPAILPDADFDHEVMQEEIFGPLLPVIPYDELGETLDMLKEKPRPLACYFFSQNESAIRRVTREFPYGGGCINDTMLHISNNHMPFGGVGNSGMGAYHGRYSFDTFSRKKGVVRSCANFDLPLRYAPYDAKKLWLLKHLL
ncbi:MAG: aldehyde dehydrogenase [Oscillospiraceae bacterium]